LNNSHTVFDGDFADDIALLYRLREDIQPNSSELLNTAAQVGLSISTKVMRNNVNANTDWPLTIGSNELKEVAEFKYLGSITNSEGSLEHKFTIPISYAGNSFTKLFIV
jgi:hypothetical protein